MLRNWGSVAERDYLPQLQWSVQVARLDAIERDPELVQRVLDTVAVATRSAYADPDDYAAFLAEDLGIEFDVAKRASNANGSSCGSTVSSTSLAYGISVKLQAKLGAVPESLELDDVVDLQFMHARQLTT